MEKIGGALPSPRDDRDYFFDIPKNSVYENTVLLNIDEIDPIGKLNSYVFRARDRVRLSVSAIVSFVVDALPTPS